MPHCEETMTTRLRKTIPLFTLFLIVCLSIVIHQATAETKTYTILPQQEEIIALNLNTGDSASGSISVNGDRAVDFWISDPQNTNVTTHNNTGHANFVFTAETSGTFLIHLYNRATDSSLTVTLNYNAVHKIFGMPQEMFLLLLIIGVILLLLVFWAILSKA
jgi:hypothetical protein